MRHLPYIVLFVVFCVFGIAAAQAQQSVEIIPQTSAKERGIALDESIATHEAIKITPDKSEIVRLDREAGTIIVGNPAHINILADSPETLIIVPKAPGASFFAVRDQDGELIMQRHVLVAAPQEDYIRVRRTCGGDDTCTPTSVYYCPDMCHEVILNTGSESTSTGGDAQQLQGSAENLSETAAPEQDAAIE